MVPRLHTAKVRAVLTLVTPLPNCSTSFDSIAKPSATAAHLHGESALDVIFCRSRLPTRRERPINSAECAHPLSIACVMHGLGRALRKAHVVVIRARTPQPARGIGGAFATCGPETGPIGDGGATDSGSTSSIRAMSLAPTCVEDDARRAWDDAERSWSPTLRVAMLDAVGRRRRAGSIVDAPFAPRGQPRGVSSSADGPGRGRVLSHRSETKRNERSATRSASVPEFADRARRAGAASVRHGQPMVRWLSTRPIGTKRPGPSPPRSLDQPT
jgi:hypothetical protein